MLFRSISLGSLEPQFYAELLNKLGLTDAGLPDQGDRSGYDVWRAKFTEIFLTKTRDEWDAVFLGSDACYAPVLTMSEALEQEHMKARGTFVVRDGVAQPAPSPRFSRTPATIERGAPWPGQHTDEALADWGLDMATIEKLKANDAVR